MEQYLELLRHIRQKGVRKPTRTRSPSTGCELDAFSVFGYQIRFDLGDGFPLVTTKEMPFQVIAGELLWFLSGATNIRSLLAQKIRIWTDWPLDRYRRETGHTISKAEFEKRIVEDEEFAAEWGDLGPVYGKQWRAWETAGGAAIDQISQVIALIKEVIRNPRAPEARRLVISAWNVGDICRMAIAPCHTLFQFDVTQGRLSCHLYQRSADVFLGVPFNIASYSLLTHLIARDVGLEVGHYVHTFGDAHLYENHLDQVDAQLTREPKPLPRLLISPAAPGLFAIRTEHLSLKGYAHDPKIEGEVAV